MYYSLVMFTIFAAAHATMYLPPLKEHYYADLVLRDLIDQMGNDLVDAADSYLEYQDGPRIGNDFQAMKEIPVELPIDYDGIETLNPNPSIRDQEYLQHSTLWSHQKSNENGSDRHRIQASGLKGAKDEKSESALPAYCTPPNPCPVGYTTENHCITDFENTAAFSRDFQSAQDCMCDKEHMIDCANEMDAEEEQSNLKISSNDLDQIVERFQEENPFFQGEKLPIAAKKGINVLY